ncbi:LOW QUALITY PROTEIN: hypothetical protein HID58_067764 [Brassica napus]|uniref:RING-type E3 ubiquitin transferase n=1 Tax=Brassica napus TaxID=3708 RepID=A0ABQ7ZJH2_BRANA|nr:LOW QUALITY PROTEIN: hypothetical protein HID58_067764 [Brassica napus]
MLIYVKPFTGKLCFRIRVFLCFYQTTMRFAAPSPRSGDISPSPSPAASPYSGVPEEILSPPSDPPLQFSPPLIAMVVVLAAAFLFVTYSRLISRRFLLPLFRRFRRWRHRRRRLLHLSSASNSSSDLRSFSPFPFDSFHYSSYSPYGLDESVIKTLPLFLYSAASCTGKSLSPATAVGKTPATAVDCAVCLLEFEEGDYVRTLPLCFHAFHLECIDEWLRSHPNCPLCRTAILRSGVVATTSPFVPLMAPRIRPSLDEESNAIVIRSETPPRTSHGVSVEIPEIHVEQAASVSVRKPEIESVLVTLPQKREITVFAAAIGSVLPDIRADSGDGKLIVAADEIDDESENGTALVEPVKMRRSRGTVIAGEVEEKGHV